MNRSQKGRITDRILIAVSALFLLGISTVFSACGPKPDGSFMHCHDAQRALQGIAVLSLLLSLFHLRLKGAGAKAACDLVLILLSVFGFLIPGHLVPLCMMPEMRCRMLMAPGAAVFSVLLALSAAGDLWSSLREGRA